MGANENRTGHDGSIVHAGHVMRFRGEKLRMSLPSASAYPNDRDLRAHGPVCLSLRLEVILTPNRTGSA